MTVTVREHVTALEGEGDLLRIDQRVHWNRHALAVGAEAARENGPAVLLEDVPGRARLASGLYGGPDQMFPRERKPWSRFAAALGMDAEIPYDRLIDRLADVSANGPPSICGSVAATDRKVDLYTLGLPAVAEAGTPTITLGVLVATVDGSPTWAPVQGVVDAYDGLTVSLPTSLVDRLSAGAEVTIALGVPAACLFAATLRWTGRTSAFDPISMARALDGVELADGRGGPTPASAEVLLDGTLRGDPSPTPESVEGWQRAVSATSVGIEVTAVATREDPILPFTPAGAALADDVHLAGIVEAARLHWRVNNYWGVTPVEWIALPAETRLGICLVASEILYAGFEWQLANTLFSFSNLFDKILVLDADTPPANLARAFDDMWVKASPSQDWTFSEPSAPAATATSYRRDGETGSRLYINAAWDPRWDSEYIAPRVTFSSSFPDDVQEFVVQTWNEIGFTAPPRTD